MTNALDDLFRSLGDPTRRRVLDLLAEQGPLSVGQISARFPELVSSGISKHLMNLRASGLVSASRHGQQQIYRVEGDRFEALLKPWVAKYERYWDTALHRLRRAAEDDHRRKSSKKRKQLG